MKDSLYGATLCNAQYQLPEDNCAQIIRRWNPIDRH